MWIGAVKILLEIGKAIFIRVFVGEIWIVWVQPVQDAPGIWYDCVRPRVKWIGLADEELISICESAILRVLGCSEKQEDIAVGQAGYGVGDARIALSHPGPNPVGQGFCQSRGGEYIVWPAVASPHDFKGQVNGPVAHRSRYVGDPDIGAVGAAARVGADGQQIARPADDVIRGAGDGCRGCLRDIWRCIAAKVEYTIQHPFRVHRRRA